MKLINSLAIESSLDELGLGAYKGQILALAQPSIRLLPTEVASDTVHLLGVTKLGGLPHLPPHIQWPTSEGLSLDFVAQLNLADLCALSPMPDLPTQGWLYFFALDWDNYVIAVHGYEALYVPPYAKPWWKAYPFAVIYFDGPLEALEYRPLPEQHWRNFPCKSYALTLQPELTLPSYGSYWHKRLLNLTGTTAAETKTLNHLYGNLTYALAFGDGRKANHHLGGYPSQVQDDVFIDAEYQLIGYALDIDYQGLLYNRWQLTGNPWRLLLQLDSMHPYDDDNFDWGRTERIYFCIKQADLLARRFEHCATTIQ